MGKVKVVQKYPRSGSEILLIDEGNGNYICMYTRLRDRLFELVTRKMSYSCADLVWNYIDHNIPLSIKIKGTDKDKIVGSTYRAFKSYHALVIKKLDEALEEARIELWSRYRPKLDPTNDDRECSVPNCCSGDSSSGC